MSTEQTESTYTNARQPVEEVLRVTKETLEGRVERADEVQQQH